MPPITKDFEDELNAIFAGHEGKKYVDVSSGDLHTRVGGYPGRDHRMPLCCRVMRSNMKSIDQILDEPPSGQGATLLIRYRLPR